MTISDSLTRAPCRWVWTNKWSPGLSNPCPFQSQQIWRKLVSFQRALETDCSVRNKVCHPHRCQTSKRVTCLNVWTVRTWEIGFRQDVPVYSRYMSVYVGIPFLAQWPGLWRLNIFRIFSTKWQNLKLSQVHFIRLVQRAAAFHMGQIPGQPTARLVQQQNALSICPDAIEIIEGMAHCHWPQWTHHENRCHHQSSLGWPGMGGVHGDTPIAGWFIVEYPWISYDQNRWFGGTSRRPPYEHLVP